SAVLDGNAGGLPERAGHVGLDVFDYNLEGRSDFGPRRSAERTIVAVGVVAKDTLQPRVSEAGLAQVRHAGTLLLHPDIRGRHPEVIPALTPRQASPALARRPRCERAVPQDPAATTRERCWPFGLASRG